MPYVCKRLWHTSSTTSKNMDLKKPALLTVIVESVSIPTVDVWKSFPSHTDLLYQIVGPLRVTAYYAEFLLYVTSFTWHTGQILKGYNLSFPCAGPPEGARKTCGLIIHCSVGIILVTFYSIQFLFRNHYFSSFYSVFKLLFYTKRHKNQLSVYIQNWSTL